jgi:predicted peroxiredoxin
MAKFLFILSRGLEDPSRSVRTMQMAGVAADEGHEVTVFLADDGVIYAKKGMCDNVIAPTGDEMADHMEKLAQKKVPILVCTPCAKVRQVDEKDLIENATFTVAKTFIALAAESKVITF